MKRTLSWRIVSTYIVAAVAGLVFLTAIATITAGIALRRERLTELLERANLVAALVESSGPSFDARILARTGGGTDGIVALLDETGAPIATQVDTAEWPDGLPDPGALDLPHSGIGTLSDGDERVEYAVVALQEDASARFVYLTRPHDRVAHWVRTIALLTLGTTAAYAVAGGVLVFRLLRWITNPIYALQGAARHYALGELDVHLRIADPPELGRLADDLNLMADELRTRITAISEQRNQREAILASMIEGVVVLGRDRRIVSLNEAAARLLRVSPGAAAGRTLIDYLRNAQLDDLATLALGSDEPVERTITLYREQPIHLQIHATPLRDDHEQGPTGTLLVMNDITRLKQLEDLRKDFVANVSHELKTPITSIKGFVETLLDGAVSDPDHAERFLRIILNHTNRLHLIIEDLLSLSRLEQGDRRISFERFDVATVVRNAVQSCAERASARSIRIEPHCEGLEQAWGNPNLIEQAIVNLVDNAIKYSPAGSGVGVRASSTESRLVIAVQDHGHGIRTTDLPRVFERFYRTDKARSRELGGTGLGLAIVKHIARAHGGDVSVTSEYGVGSTFTVELPQNREGAGDSDIGKVPANHRDSFTAIGPHPDRQTDA